MKRSILLTLLLVASTSVASKNTIAVANSVPQSELAVNIDILSAGANYSKIVLSSGSCTVSFRIGNQQMEKLYGSAMDQMIQIFMKKCNL